MCRWAKPPRSAPGWCCRSELGTTDVAKALGGSRASAYIDCGALPRRASCSMNTENGSGVSRMLAGGITKDLSMWAMPGVDQGPQSRQRRAAAGTQRELE
jgi:hypothetical protein